MNIIHISSVNSEINGIGSVLTILAKEQRFLGHNVQVVTIAKGDFVDLSSAFIKITNRKEFTNLIKCFSPDIVIFHSVYSLEFLLFASVLKIKNIPYAIELHGALSKQNLQKHRFKKKIANLFFYNRFIKNACTIIYLNAGEYTNSVVKKINAKSVIIPNGCYIPLLDCNFLERECSEKIEYVYLGRIELHHKALDILLNALCILQQKGYDKNIHFSFYGIGEGEDFVWFKKEKAFCNADVFVLTSRSEGMPVAVLEALSYGLPCILTSQTNMADVVSSANAGWIATLSAESIAETIVRSVAEYRNNFRLYRQRSFSLASEYDWKKIAEQSICLYEQMI